MASLKDIRRRILAVRGTQKVTRAMKLVAAAKLKKAQQAAIDSRAFSSELHETVMRVSKRLGVRAPLLWQRPKDINCLDLIVVTSDRGLCGGFNENLLRMVEEGIADGAKYSIASKLFVMGKKGVRYLSARNYDVEAWPGNMSEGNQISWILDRTIARYLDGASAGATVAFNRFVSAGRQEATFWNLFPLYKAGSQRERHMEYLYEPGRTEALDTLCIEAIRGAMRQLLRESKAAELASRMAAMDNATRNADEMISHLTFVYNRKRQEAITAELMDIVGGAEALK